MCTHKCHRLSRHGGEGEILEDRPLGAVAEADVPELDLAGGGEQVWGAGLVAHLGLLVQQVQHILHVDETLLWNGTIETGVKTGIEIINS